MVRVDCPNAGCTERPARGCLEYHVEDYCDHRMVECEWCEKVSHVSYTCSYHKEVNEARFIIMVAKRSRLLVVRVAGSGVSPGVQKQGHRRTRRQLPREGGALSRVQGAWRRLLLSPQGAGRASGGPQGEIHKL